MARLSDETVTRIKQEVSLVRLGQADGQELAGVVPLVEGFGGADALVALEPDEGAAQNGGHGLGGSGLAHPGLTLEEEGLADRLGEEEGGGQSLVDEVVGLVEGGHELAAIGEGHAGASWARSRS